MNENCNWQWHKEKSKMKRPSLRKWEERLRSAREESTLEESDCPREEQKARAGEARSRSNFVAHLSTCVATALLPPGGHVALVTAAAAAAADLCPLLQWACCSMLTWPAAQRRCRHCALQLRGGGEWVGHTTSAHCRLEAVWQLTLNGQTQRLEKCYLTTDLGNDVFKPQCSSPTQSLAMLTCLMEEWWAATDLCCMAALTCLYCWDTSISVLDSEGEEDEEDLDTEEEEEVACWRIRCSISCSCWSAFTKAAFSRLVCSAFRAFFWLDDMHWSHRMVPAFSFLQREVKSVLHWAQVYGSFGMELAMAAAGPRLPTWKTESFFRP